MSKAEAVTLRTALPADAPACVSLRGQTRENAATPERLAVLGVTPATWGADIASGQLKGHIAEAQGRMLGYGFGDTHTGEVVVLALLPEAESLGLGRRLLAAVVSDLRACGHQRLFLGCSSDPASRSYGFYRHLGWRSTGRTDRLGDEELELV